MSSAPSALPSTSSSRPYALSWILLLGLLTAGCVCFALLQAAQGCGFGAQWLTAWMADDVEVARHLGLADNERIVGFIHIGTPKLQVPERERPDAAALLQDWQP